MSIGLPELLAIALIALLVFGPDRLPEAARQAARIVARVRQETSQGVAELKRAAGFDELERELGAVRRELAEVGREVTRLSDPQASYGGSKASEDAALPPPIDPEAT